MCVHNVFTLSLHTWDHSISEQPSAPEKKGVSVEGGGVGRVCPAILATACWSGAADTHRHNQMHSGMNQCAPGSSPPRSEHRDRKRSRKQTSLLSRGAASLVGTSLLYGFPVCASFCYFHCKGPLPPPRSLGLKEEIWLQGVAPLSHFLFFEQTRAQNIRLHAQTQIYKYKYIYIYIYLNTYSTHKGSCVC